MSDLDHCEWFGISCDGEGYVTKVELSNNNLVGKFPADSVASFYKLQKLDLSNNNLSGIMAEENLGALVSWNETSEQWDQGPGPATYKFFNLRELVHVDLSRNKLSGEVDILFAPALEHVNFSHNNFTSIDSFKVSKLAHAHVVTLSFLTCFVVRMSALQKVTQDSPGC